MSLRTDTPVALRATWLVLTVAAMTCVVAPLVFSADFLEGLIPVCEAKVRGGSCALCGMTTGFILISRGEIAQAQKANAGAPVLYLAFLLNFVSALSYSIMTLLRRRTGELRSCKWSH
jgi:hypothetical protein